MVRRPGERGDLNANNDAISGTPVREEDWGLDPTGNWSDYTEKTSGSTDLDQDRTCNKVNEITDITETTGTAWVTPAQDKNGNMTTVPKPSSPANGLTLKYDAWNRLVEVKDGQTVVGKYEYDALNRRVKRHLDSDSPGSLDGVDTYVHYFYDAAWQVLETRDTTTESDQPENLQPDYQYVWSGRYIDAPILRDENTDQDSLCDDARLYYLADANFNVTTLTDTSGDAVERYLYDSYGSVTIYDATWSNTRSVSSYDNTVLYTGREFDIETRLYYYRARYLHMALGRFVRRDPIGYGDGMNAYQYVLGRPTWLLDPLGLKCYKTKNKQVESWEVVDIKITDVMQATMTFWVRQWFCLMRRKVKWEWRCESCGRTWREWRAELEQTIVREAYESDEGEGLLAIPTTYIGPGWVTTVFEFDPDSREEAERRCVGDAYRNRAQPNRNWARDWREIHRARRRDRIKPN